MKKVWSKPEIESLDTRLTALSTDFGLEGDGQIWSGAEGGYVPATALLPFAPPNTGNGIPYSGAAS